MTEPGTARPVDPRTFGDQPQELLWQSIEASLAMPAGDVAEIQLAAVQKRFEELRGKLPPLASLAAENGIAGIPDLNTAARLLFKHSVYKSYPVSLIEKSRFDRMTQWLGNLTTQDLSGVKTAGLETIDDWLDALLRDAGLRIIHTTGTSGKLSFLPRGHADAALQMRSGRLSLERIGGSEPRGLDKVPMIVVGSRTMFNGYGAQIEAFVRDLYGGDEGLIHAMNPGRMSADVLSLAGRLAAADNRGELGRSQVSPAILKRLDQFVEGQKTAAERRAQFFDATFDKLSGQRIIMTGNWGMYCEMLDSGRKRGLRQVFAPESCFVCAGGDKGKALPDGHRGDIAAFLGIPEMPESYGMSEMSALMPKCAGGNYHALPWMLVFVLDAETGQPAPRSGTHTGRFGVIDLSYQTRWGGVLSGDEVTMTFGKCACGIEGPHIGAVRRYSATEGGDDKITCAGAPQAHDNALAFLAELS